LSAPCLWHQFLFGKLPIDIIRVKAWFVTFVDSDNDGDSFPDSLDNCPDTFNRDQSDSDADGHRCW